MLNNLPRPPVLAVLQQHMDEAGFATVNRQADIWNPVYEKEDLDHTHERIRAHLEGLQVAGKHAIKLAFELLEKWESESEVFLCTYLLNNAESSSENHQYYLTLVEYIEQNEEFIEPASLALTWAQTDSKFVVAKFWWESSSEHLKAAAFNAMITFELANINDVIQTAFNNSSIYLKQRACRIVGEGCYHDFSNDLRSILNEQNAELRYEAAIALTLLNEADQQSWNTLIETLPLFEDEMLQRGIMIWAMFAPPELFQQWYLNHKGKPEQYRSLLWALAYRGDSQYLELITRFIVNNLEPRLAAYVFGHITGLDLDDEEFYLPEEDEDEQDEDDEQDTLDDDSGLVKPDANKIIAWFKSNQGNFSSTENYLAGKPLSESAEEVLEVGTQTQRIQAAAFLTVSKKESYLRDALHR